MQGPRIKQRNEFPAIINACGYKQCIELGVAKGGFSQVLIQSDLEMLYLVDKWNDERHQPEEIQLVQERLKGHEERYKIMHMSFDDAWKEFQPQSLDFIYIDGYAHTGQQGVDFRGWTQLLRPGGMIAGHDYCSNFPKTVNIVNEFARWMGRRLFVTRGDTTYPSWYMYY